jgi:hypothetical protein
MLEEEGLVRSEVDLSPSVFGRETWFMTAKASTSLAHAAQ